MSTATTSVEVGQIRQSPDDTFVLILQPGWALNGRQGWAVRRIDRWGRPTGEPTRWMSNLTLNAWDVIDLSTITEPQ